MLFAGSLGHRALNLVLMFCHLVSSLPTLHHGQPRRYELVLTWELGSPDGYQREMFKINGQFPGPLLEINQGEEVEIFVSNKSPYNTTVHYHGIEMLGTPWADGVPGITQIAIQPGCAFTYRWTATQHGTYFYHSHSDSQVNDGLYGPIVIHAAPGTAKPYGLLTKDPRALQAISKAEAERVPLLIGDWRHLTSSKEWAISKASHIEHLCFDSIIVNGKGNVNCLTPEQQAPLTTPGQLGLLGNLTLTSKSCVPPEALAALSDAIGTVDADISVIPPDLFGECTPTTTAGEVVTVTKKKCDTLTEGKWAVFDLVGAFSLHTAMISLDEVRMYVVAIDGNYIAPVPADAVLLVNGQRYTVLAHFVTPKAYKLRISSVIDPQIMYGHATIDYKVEGQEQSPSPSVPFINERGMNLTADIIVFDGMRNAIPFPAGKNVPSASVDATYKVTMGFGASISEFIFNGTARPEPDPGAPNHVPLLFDPQPGLQDNHTITVASSSSWVDYIIQVTPGQPPHPIHVHGRHFYVLGAGQGAFTWDTVDAAAKELPPGTINLVNPQLRDTFVTPASSLTAPAWLALRRASDNEGVWMIHCHIQSHLQGGMSMIIQDGTDGGIEVPKEYREYQCQAH
ncbi:multicopper oxidase-domain-containing protein [Microdochium bolleyi]|uniref:Multicopper oxidase-domain-containing protein n=1 Tax=Microdochium bolleyi TaxID=196109 RepID=A0A136IZS0_9PEZI|nr:multicopper oxidase-domain-containing protein [Microdochium bolleyi]